MQITTYSTIQNDYIIYFKEINSFVLQLNWSEVIVKSQDFYIIIKKNIYWK